jgi:hypothetical protein
LIWFGVVISHRISHHPLCIVSILATPLISLSFPDHHTARHSHFAPISPAVAELEQHGRGVDSNTARGRNRLFR